MAPGRENEFLQSARARRTSNKPSNIKVTKKVLHASFSAHSNLICTEMGPYMLMPSRQTEFMGLCQALITSGYKMTVVREKYVCLPTLLTLLGHSFPKVLIISDTAPAASLGFLEGVVVLHSSLTKHRAAQQRLVDTISAEQGSRQNAPPFPQIGQET